MTYTLFPHQERGAAFLTSEPGTKGLFFGMGTGKTVTALEALKRVKASRCVIIAPPIALPMWKAEAEAYLVQPAKILKTGATELAGPERIVIASYAIAAKRSAELREWLNKDLSVLICDESHALKSVKAKRTKTILGSWGIAQGADYAWMLTGTPITRWNDDVYPFLCNADLKGMRETIGGVSEEKFQLRYTVRQKRQFPGARWPVQMVVGNQNTDELARLIYEGGSAIRVDLQEVFDNMPPLTHSRYAIPLDGDAELKANLKAMEKMSLADIQQKLQSKELSLIHI